MASKEIDFRADVHEYRVDGRLQPGVTNVIRSSGFIPINDFMTDEDLRRGQMVHKACQFDDEGDLDESTCDDVVMGRVRAWRKFLRESGFKIELNEHHFYSHVHGFCGTLDRAGILFEKRAVVEIKGPTVEPWQGIQTAAYALAFDDPMKRYAVHLSDGKYKLEVHTDKTDRPIFLSALAVYNRRKRDGVLDD